MITENSENQVAYAIAWINNGQTLTSSPFFAVSEQSPFVKIVFCRPDAAARLAVVSSARSRRPLIML